MAEGAGNGAGRPVRQALTKNQLEAIRLIVEEGKSAAYCQKTLPVTAKTWQAWRAGPLFLPALAAARKEYEEGVWSKLQAAANNAAQTVIDIAANEKEKGSVRLMAANAILDRSGFKKAEAAQPTVQPYQSREELLTALTTLPPELLDEALKLIRGG